MESQRSLSSTQKKLVLAGGILFLLSVYYLRSVYIPILVSYFLAFLLNPIVVLAERRGFGRIGPITALLVLVFVGIIAAAIATVPRLLVQARELVEMMPKLFEAVTIRLEPITLKYFGYNPFVQWNLLAKDVGPWLSKLPAESLLAGIFVGTAHLFGTLLTVLMIPILTFYILKDYNRLNALLLQMVPFRYRVEVAEVVGRLAAVLGALIRGQFLVCAILAIFYAATLTTVGLEMGLLVGVLAGFMNLVPVIGPLVSMGLALLIAILGGAAFTQCAAIVGVFLVANLLDGTLLTPRIVGKQMGISPLVIILALLAGAELLGFLGILLALPILAMSKVLGGYFVGRYYQSSFYKEGSAE